MVSSSGTEFVTSFGDSIVARIEEELGATQTNDFPELRDIKNLAGESTGFVHVYRADKLAKASYLSINVAPGARYFNIQVTPEAVYDAPRFSMEGMVTVHGSQVSMDMFPDVDMFMDVRHMLEQMKGVNEVYEAAKQTDIDFRPSRFPHMRIFCSPFFLNVFKASAEQLLEIDALAHRYFDEWKKILADATKTDSTAADERRKRRRHMSDMVMELDPDREMIVQVYGEDITSAIERAVMYYD